MYGYTLNVAKETDLIYEGIATWAPAVGGPTPGAKETDLIYEGIATVNKWVRILHLPTSERNWPDLRRDCDAWVMDRDITLCCRGKKLTWFTKGLRRTRWTWPHMSPRPRKETDLIYEGIATRIQRICFGSGKVGKETDLIYEGIATQGPRWYIFLSLSSKETDLIYEGIATLASYIDNNINFKIKETDLIYEGIATSQIFSHFFLLYLIKKLTWFTKGLRHNNSRYWV